MFMSEVVISRVLCILVICFVAAFVQTDHFGTSHESQKRPSTLQTRRTDAIVKRGRLNLPAPKLRPMNREFMREYTSLQRHLSHSKNTKFIKSDIGTHHFIDSKRNGIRGLVCGSDINAGEILIVERPLLLFEKDTSNPTNTDQLIQKKVSSIMESDPEFSQIWLSINRKLALDQLIEIPMGKPERFVVLILDTLLKRDKMFPTRLGKDKLASVRSFLRFQSFGIYALLSKISIINPASKKQNRQNVAVVFGGKWDDYVCVMMAITDIPRRTELVRGVHPKRTIGGQGLGAILGDNKSESEKIHEIKQFVESGQLFKTMRGVHLTSPPDWTGKEFQLKTMSFQKP